MVNFDKNEIDYKSGVLNTGNLYIWKYLFDKAKSEKELNVGFLGGSITQGSLASSENNTYVSKFSQKLKEELNLNEINFINAGIGATDSHFGVARVGYDLLRHDLDLIIIEFSVNDEENDFYLETYEGLLRRIISFNPEITILLLHNVEYSSGRTAERIHSKLARHYNLTSVSMKDSVYKYLKDNDLLEAVSEDGLHPNDLGMELISELLLSFIQDVRGKVATYSGTELYNCLKEPITKNRYENSIIFNQKNSEPKLNGFKPMQLGKEAIKDVFKGGWYSQEKGSKISFNIWGKDIYAQFKKTIIQPAPTAKYSIYGGDNELISSGQIDANFDETWGDKLFIQELVSGLELAEYKVEFEIESETAGLKAPFELISLIVN